MKLQLALLKANPFRDFCVDPIDAKAIDKLRESIKQDGFWGGVVCRKDANGGYEIGAGHHRIEAAKAEGIKTADVFVGTFDDEAMIRVYARENATQRGNTVAAMAGSVAGTVRYLARAILTGGVSQICDSEHALAKAKEALSSDRGLGEPAITRFLEDVPGINAASVRQQLATLKASGDYQRIIVEVSTQVEAELQASIAEAEAEQNEVKAAEDRKNQQAAAKAKATNENAPKTFDFEGVSPHLQIPSHLDEFRRLVTSEVFRMILPIENQKDLAKEIVKRSETCGGLSAGFIREQANLMLSEAIKAQEELSRKEKERLLKLKRTEAFKDAQIKFVSALRGLQKAHIRITKLVDEWPDGEAMPLVDSFLPSISDTLKVLRNLERWAKNV